MTKVLIIQGERIVLDEQTVNLIKYIKSNPYSEITIKVQGGTPVMVERIRESIKL